MRFEEVRSHLLDKLENEIPAHLNYHHIQYTQDSFPLAEYCLPQKIFRGLT